MFNLEDLPDEDYIETLRTISALTCRMACDAAWSTIMIMTTETYPTIVRYFVYLLNIRDLPFNLNGVMDCANDGTDVVLCF